MKKIVILLLIALNIINGNSQIVRRPPPVNGPKQVPSHILATQIKGIISISDLAFNAMNRVCNGDFVNSGLHIEIWAVRYEKTTTNLGENLTKIYLENKIEGTQLTKSKVVDGISFNISNLNNDAEQIVIAYIDKTPNEYPYVKIKGIVTSDLGGNSITKKSSNAKDKIGIEHVIGLYSIHPNSEGSNILFTTSFSNGVGMQTMGFLEDIGDFFSGAAKLVWDGVNDLAEFTVDATGAIIVNTALITITFIREGTLPKVRLMTKEEFSWANSKLFNGQLKAEGKIYITNLTSIKGRECTIPLPGGGLTINLGKGYYDPIHYIKGTAYPVPGQVFIHECTHAWQILTTNDIAIYFKAISAISDGEAAYKYDKIAEKDKAWQDFGLEQQAHIADACFEGRESENCTPAKFGSWEEDQVVKNIRKSVLFDKIQDYITASVKINTVGNGYFVVFAQLSDSLGTPNVANLADAFEIKWTYPIYSDLYCSGRHMMRGQQQPGKLESAIICSPNITFITDCSSTSMPKMETGALQYGPKRCRAITTQSGYKTVVFKVTGFDEAYSYFTRPIITIKPGIIWTRPDVPKTSLKTQIQCGDLVWDEPYMQMVDDPCIFEVAGGWVCKGATRFEKMRNPVESLREKLEWVKNPAANFGKTPVANKTVTNFEIRSLQNVVH